jgi:hypothetical protein
MGRSAPYDVLAISLALILTTATSGCTILGIGVGREYKAPLDPQAAPISYNAHSANDGSCVDSPASF